MATAGLLVKDLLVLRGGRRVLRGATLTAPRGEVTAVLGPNGAGKTTLLEAVLGIVSPSGGRIEIDGVTVYDSTRGINLSPEKRGAAYVPQDYGLFPHLTVLENIAFPLLARRVPRGQALAEAKKAAETLGVDDVLHRKPPSLSGGQRQRVALARALAAQPRLLLLDEPFTALDAPTREKLRPLLRGVLRRAGITALMVTHSFSDAWILGDKIYILDGGAARGGVPPDELARHPLRYGAAQLLGYHILEARLAAPGRIEIPGLGILEAKTPPTAKPGDRLLVAFRGDDIILNPPPEAPNTFNARVREVAATRYGYRIVLEAGDAFLATEVPRGQLLAHGGPPRPGERVRASIPPAVMDVAPG